MDKFNHILSQASKASNYQKIDTEAAWAKFQQSAGIAEPKVTAKVISLQNKSMWLGIAASLFIVVTACVAFWPLEDQYKTVIAVSQPTIIKMFDGSVITADKNAVITFPTRQEDLTERKILLKGDASFNVAHNAELPYRVIKEDLLVEVLGTEFTIEDNEEGGIDIENHEGSVKASDVNDPTSFVVLNKGDKFSFSEDGFKDENYVAPAPPPVVVPKVIKNLTRKYTLFEVYTNIYNRTEGRVDLVDSAKIEGNAVIDIDLSQSISTILSTLEKKADFEYTIFTEQNKIEISKLKAKN